MLQSAITIVFPILCIFQKYYQDYQEKQIACMDALTSANSKTILENPKDDDEGLNLLPNIDEKHQKKKTIGKSPPMSTNPSSKYPMAEDTCMYSKPSVYAAATKLFPPPISCLRLFDEGKPFHYYKFDKNNGSFSREELIIPRRTMSCLRHNGNLKMWFPRRPRVEEQPHQEGDEDDDDDDSSDYYTDSDEDSDDDSDSENPDDNEPFDNNNEHDSNHGDHYHDNNVNEEDKNDADDREGNADNNEGNQNNSNNNN